MQLLSVPADTAAATSQRDSSAEKGLSISVEEDGMRARVASWSSGPDADRCGMMGAKWGKSC